MKRLIQNIFLTDKKDPALTLRSIPTTGPHPYLFQISASWGGDRSGGLWSLLLVRPCPPHKQNHTHYVLPKWSVKHNYLLIEITEENLFQVIVDLFLAGTDTTAGTQRWVILHLLHNPSVRKKCQDEIFKVRKGVQY